MEKNLTNDYSIFNKFIVSKGIKATNGENQASAYVIACKIKNKISKTIFTEKKLFNNDKVFNLCNMIDNWSCAAVFKFIDIYKDYDNFDATEFERAIKTINKKRIKDKKIQLDD
jgi:hypothetical protein